MRYEDTTKELSQVLEEFFSKQASLFEEAASSMIANLKAGYKILIFGNGGSAAQAQHFAAEMVNKFLKERQALPAISLTTDTSTLTSISNDTSFDLVFSRQIEALGEREDVAIGLSTSGNSPNVIKAIDIAKEKGMLTVALTGKGGGKLASSPDYLLDVPSESVPRIQEVHLFLLHLLAQKIEKELS